MFLTTVVLAVAVGLPPPAAIQETIDAFVAKAHGVVTVVGTVERGATHVYYAGSPQPGAPKFDENTEFQIGSISKTFTATVLAEMVLAKRVSLSDPISLFLPANVKAPQYHGKSISLLNLAEQNSGLPRLPDNLSPADANDPYADYTTQRLYDFLNGYTLTRAPGAQYEYSNLGVGLLGQLLVNRAKAASYDALVQQSIFKPLGMTSTAAVLTPALRSKMMPGFAEDLSAASPWTFTDATAGAGAINSTIADMLKYLQANMQAPQGSLGAAIAMAHMPRVPIALGTPSRIGLVWMTSNGGVTWHNGETGGYTSFIGFSGDVGVVVLSNVANNNVTALGTHLLEPSVIPKVPPVEGPPAPRGNSPYVGVYELAPNFRITIFEENGTLYGQATGQSRFTLVREAGDRWRIKEVDATVTFSRDASGKVTSLVLHQNGQDLPGKRVRP